VYRLVGPPNDAGLVPEQGEVLSDSFYDWFNSFAEDSSGASWAVGHGGRIAKRLGIDAGWSFMADNRTASLYAVWSSSADNAIAVGDRRHLRRNGTGTWDTVTALGGGNLEGMHAISGFTVTDYAIGGSNAFFTGKGAVGVSTLSSFDWIYPGPTPVRAVRYFANGRLYAAGNDGVFLQRFRDAGIEQLYDGGFDAGILGLWAFEDREDLEVVGRDGVALRYDGNVWSRVGPFTASDLRSVYVPDPSTGPWRVGASGAWQIGTLMQAGDFEAVHGAGAGDVFMVGSDGGIFHYTFDAGVRGEQSGTKLILYGVYENDAGVVYAVGARGAILRRGR
jgi:hypothetical protein